MKKIKRILALAGVIFLLGLYGFTLFTALMDGPSAGRWLQLSLACSIGIPVIIYACMLVYRWTHKSDKK
ncbi:MAG: hypothetical protein HFH59_12405 [Lachnospiraceae bacterium]|jgi:putative hydrolase of the HAD superfamily|nr:hypothetical protein [Lachnospiraceae bacterium]MCI9100540.1 hypothetical protein [Lachnospiraceae bacterium]MCI9358311.1 hypothetical protein [Lachnospiraceae bacterium]